MSSAAKLTKNHDPDECKVQILDIVLDLMHVHVLHYRVVMDLIKM